jgi:hypothetical protein
VDEEYDLTRNYRELLIIHTRASRALSRAASVSEENEEEGEEEEDEEEIRSGVTTPELVAEFEALGPQEETVEDEENAVVEDEQVVEEVQEVESDDDEGFDWAESKEISLVLSETDDEAGPGMQ